MPVRYRKLLWLACTVGALVLLHVVIQQTAPQYTLPTSYLEDYIPNIHKLHLPGTGVPDRANGTFLMLARGRDLSSVLQSMHSMEARFNNKHAYPWVILSDRPFEDDFIRRAQVQASGHVYFGQISPDDWVQPNWIDNQRAADARRQFAQAEHGSSLLYRNMYRWYSGLFFHHGYMQSFRYYWRVDPGAEYHCDIQSDPFAYMEDRNLSYGFTLTTKESASTTPTLWNSIGEFKQRYPHLLEKDNAMGYLSDDGGKTYKMCRFHSSFEIADMDFFRGERYSQYFDFLDHEGGIYYELWDDSVIHSIGAALLLRKDKVHLFEDIGYGYKSLEYCPADETIWQHGRCSCDPKASSDPLSSSCLAQWQALERKS